MEMRPPPEELILKESDVRALRQQFGVPMKLLRHTGVYALAAPSKADVGPRRRPLLIFIPSGWPGKGHGSLV